MVIKVLLIMISFVIVFCYKKLNLNPVTAYRIRKMLYSTIADTSLLQEAVSKFLQGEVKFTPTSGGVNNVVQYVETADKKRYILRVYNNGNNSYRVKFEHTILDLLRSKPLSFQIPTTIPSLDNGKSFVGLSNGAEASLFNIIPGTLPKLSKIQEIGLAAGELNSVMASISLQMDSPNPPYYELYNVHHAVTKELFYSMMMTPVFDPIRVYSDGLVQEIQTLELLIIELLNLNLPKQWIHGDLHYDNVLVTEDGVSGLLDFEFCAYDWRVMELAVCLSKYAGEENAMEYFKEFISGYMKFGVLSDQEIDVLPDMINLRILSNVVYFVGRAIAKEDGIESLTERAQSYLSRVQWIKKNRKFIADTVRQAALSK